MQILKTLCELRAQLRAATRTREILTEEKLDAIAQDLRLIREALERISPRTFSDPRRKVNPIGTTQHKASP